MFLRQPLVAQRVKRHLPADQALEQEPDVIVFGKSLTNGLNPLSGIWAREELIRPDIWGAGMTHSTYSSNPARNGWNIYTTLPMSRRCLSIG